MYTNVARHRALKGFGQFQTCNQDMDCPADQGCCHLPAYDLCMRGTDCQMVLDACAAGATGEACKARQGQTETYEEGSPTYQEGSTHTTVAPSTPSSGGGGGTYAPPATKTSGSSAPSSTTILGMSPLVAGAVGIVGVLVLAKIIFG